MRLQISASPSKPLVKYFGKGREWYRRFDEITGGFDQLSHAPLLPGTVQLHSPPEEVESYGDHVHITYQTPDTLTADYMIVVTTATAAQLLRSQPPLSHGKENALRSFHYSSVTKVFLACMQSFWEHEGISGDESSTAWPSCFIHYPSHTFPSGTRVILASFTMDDNSFFAQAADVVLDDLATVHDLFREELQALCPYSMINTGARTPTPWVVLPSLLPTSTWTMPRNLDGEAENLDGDDFVTSNMLNAFAYY
ncbi:hypothetical protein MG293_008467 [Ovis ammon polii]|uniref:Amine oxidase domain-containing protein n=1 Tax=Ovis ammon polii TaxID=230172 RepID=A0AAD4UD38_OVIAM|nr:hypothetical protein MG293_008467 [Ovis ammon polii]